MASRSIEEPARADVLDIAEGFYKGNGSKNGNNPDQASHRPQKYLVKIMLCCWDGRKQVTSSLCRYVSPLGSRWQC